MTWADGRLCAFDVETTGTDPFEARIVSAAIVFCGGDEPTQPIAFLADPGVEIPAQATAVHGITTARARSLGLPSVLVIDALLNTLANRPQGSPIIVQNAPYDLTVLDCEARRHGFAPLFERDPRCWVIDPRCIDLWLERYRRGPRKLADLCRHYGVMLDGAHDAAADALAAARVAYVLGRYADVVRRGADHDEIVEWLALRREWDRIRADLPALHAAQARWHAEHAQGLTEHFRRQGRDEQVPADWPFIPQPVRRQAA
ncbi:MAG: exonuclease domain-containing protein [Acidiferrobacteraceae bacterium]